MKTFASLPKSELSFNIDEYLKKYIGVSPQRESPLPGSNCFPMLQNFVKRYFEMREKYLEFVQFAYLDWIQCRHFVLAVLIYPKNPKVYA